MNYEIKPPRDTMFKISATLQTSIHSATALIMISSVLPVEPPAGGLTLSELADPGYKIPRDRSHSK